MNEVLTLASSSIVRVRVLRDAPGEALRLVDARRLPLRAAQGRAGSTPDPRVEDSGVRPRRIAATYVMYAGCWLACAIGRMWP